MERILNVVHGNTIFQGKNTQTASNQLIPGTFNSKKLPKFTILEHEYMSYDHSLEE